MSKQHEIIVDKVIKDLSPEYVLRKNHNGTARLKTGGMIKYGLGKGTADTVGRRKSDNIYTEIEIKTLKYKTLSSDQKKHLQSLKKDGCVVFIAYQEFSANMYRLYDIDDYITQVLRG